MNVLLMWQLAWRFRSSKRQNGFISFISASSTMGIALGCFVLIVLLSVMNGFERELKDRLLSIIPHGELYAASPAGIVDWQSEIARLAKDPRIVSIEPYSKATGMLQKGSQMKAVEVSGIDVAYVDRSALSQSISEQDWSTFTSQPQSVLLGAGIIEKLKLSVGDKVQLLLPRISKELSMLAPKTLWLTLAGEIKVGGELDNHLAYMHLETTAPILGLSEGAQGIRFRFSDPFSAPQITRELGYEFNQGVYMSFWTLTQGHLYQDIQLVRVVVYIALILVIGVACFNIVSTLVMAVNEKQAEVAMLKSMGARDNLIIGTFMLQGLINGVMGTLLGVVSGVLVAQNLTSIALFIERLLGVQFLSSDIYFIDFLPSQLLWHEVAATVVIALLLSLLATIYPARKAAGIRPAEILGH